MADAFSRANWALRTAPHRTAPEVIEDWPWCRAPAFVFAIGQLLLGLVATTAQTTASPLGTIGGLQRPSRSGRRCG